MAAGSARGPRLRHVGELRHCGGRVQGRAAARSVPLHVQEVSNPALPTLPYPTLLSNAVTWSFPSQRSTALGHLHEGLPRALGGRLRGQGSKVCGPPLSPPAPSNVSASLLAACSVGRMLKLEAQRTQDIAATGRARAIDSR